MVAVPVRLDGLAGQQPEIVVTAGPRWTVVVESNWLVAMWRRWGLVGTVPREVGDSIG